MTMPDERTRAVLQVEKLFYKLFVDRYLLGKGKKVLIPKEDINELGQAFRHYPSKYDLIQSSKKLPSIWGKPE